MDYTREDRTPPLARVMGRRRNQTRVRRKRGRERNWGECAIFLSDATFPRVFMTQSLGGNNTIHLNFVGILLCTIFVPIVVNKTFPQIFVVIVVSKKFSDDLCRYCIP